MKTYFKNFFVLTISVCFLFMFTNCEGTVKKAEGENAGLLNEETEEIDMYDYVFSFGVTSHTGNMPELLPDEAFDYRGDKILKRYKDTADKYNCEVNVFDMDVAYTQVGTKLLASLAVNDKFADLIETYPSSMSGALELFISWTDMENIDLESGKWGTKNLIDGMYFNENYYGVYPSYWGLPYPWYSNCMFFIPEYLGALSIESPHELYEKDMWTWDNFAEVCRKYTRVENEEQKYGFVITPQLQFIKAMFLSNGVKALHRDEKGSFQFGLDNSNALYTMDYLSKLLNDEKVGVSIEDSWILANRGIMSGLYAFHCDASILAFFQGEAHYAQELKIPFGIVSFPLGPNGNKNESTGYYGGKYLALPGETIDSSMEFNSILINDIFEPLDGEDKETWKDYMRDNFFFEDSSFAHFMKNYENAHPVYDLYLQEGNNKINNICMSFLRNKKTPTEIIENIKPSILTYLKEKNN